MATNNGSPGWWFMANNPLLRTKERAAAVVYLDLDTKVEDYNPYDFPYFFKKNLCHLCFPALY